MPTPDFYLRLANECSGEIEAARKTTERLVARIERRRRKYWLKANRAGATYDEIVERCDVSDGKLAQEIRQAKAETRDPKLAERPSQNPARR